MSYISALWDEVKADVIRNCFRKAAFDVWNDLEEADSSPLKDEDLQNFPDYATVDDDLVTICTRTLDEMIAEATTVVNEKEEDSKQDEENGQVEDDEPRQTTALTACLQHLNELRKVLTSLDHADEMLSYANKIDNFLAAIHFQNLKQMKIDTFSPAHHKNNKFQYVLLLLFCIVNALCFFFFFFLNDEQCTVNK